MFVLWFIEVAYKYGKKNYYSIIKRKVLASQKKCYMLMKEHYHMRLSCIKKGMISNLDKKRNKKKGKENLITRKSDQTIIK